jgi:hypothetical protein
MAEINRLSGSDPVRLGPPFGGITRIRFKGFVYDVSAIRLPRTFTRNYGHRAASQ